MADLTWLTKIYFSVSAFVQTMLVKPFLQTAYKQLMMEAKLIIKMIELHRRAQLHSPVFGLVAVCLSIHF